jgi:sugar phosphate isomerase/epimerase
MKLDGASGHLTYCSNIHPGETWTEVRANLGRFVPSVRDQVARGRPFGIGLRLSAEAAQALARPDTMGELKAFLARENLYIFTLNGFPYGTFHGKRVKEDVYLPDWQDVKRLQYTDLLADLLAELLPEESGLIGSVSTVPGAFKPNASTPEAVQRIVDLYVRHAAHLVQVRARTGKYITLAIEPEPCCMLETVEESVAFFRDHLFSDAAAKRLAELTGLDMGKARQALHDHLGLCLDLCHAAVEFEDPAACVKQLAEANVGVYKMQVTAGLRLPKLSPEALAGVKQFDDPVYLHQVVESGPSGIKRYVDLPEALRSVGAGAVDGKEWRVHCHVPVFIDDMGAFSSTQAFIREILRLHRVQPVSTHLEVETYTWGVLPPNLRTSEIDKAIAREIGWVRDELAA